LPLVRQAARWRPRNNRQIWLIVSSLVVAVCAEAVVIPAKRGGLACAVTGLIGMGLLVTGHRRQRRERAALAAGRAAAPRDGIPADVIGLVAAGQKIRAIKRYRELTGVGLKEAKVIIDGL
jgi:ribosomal protein L7/L12